LFISEPDQSTVRATTVALSLDFNVIPVHALADWHSAIQIDSVVKKNVFFMAVSPFDKIIYISGVFCTRKHCQVKAAHLGGKFIYKILIFF
jgi:hypothetical protein